MINVSKEFRNAMKTRTDFKENAKITFADGTTLELGEGDFTVSGNSLVDGAGSSSFPLGTAIEKVVEIELMNDDDHLSSYDFYGAVVNLYLTFQLSETVEKINYGTFTVVTPETYGSTVVIQAVDDMYKADKAYTTALSFPAQLGNAVREACQTCGIYLLTTTFANDNFTIQQKPSDLTFREFFAMAAMIAGGFARVDYQGRLEIKTFDFTPFEVAAAMDGGSFDGETPYETGDEADGGSFSPWDNGDVVDGGTFAQADDYHVFYSFKNITVDTDDVVITGVQTTADDVTYLSGTEGYVLSVENQLIAGQEQAAVTLIGQKVIGLRFRPFTADHIAYPLAEFGDLAYIIDRRNRVYQTVLTDIDFTWFGYTTLKCSADSPLRNSSRYASQLTQAIVAARHETQMQLSAYDMAVQMLTSLITQSLGAFKTEQIQDDGSTIFYMHDKPTLAESQYVWRMAGNVFSVSSDGGKTWNAGLDAEGNAILNVLSAIGIKAEWIEADNLSSVSAKIGGWLIGEIPLYNNSTASDGTIYRVFLQPPAKTNPEETWIISCQKSTNGGQNFYGIAWWKADGDIQVSNLYVSGDADITGNAHIVGNATVSGTIAALNGMTVNGTMYSSGNISSEGLITGNLHSNGAYTGTIASEYGSWFVQDGIITQKL